MTLNSVSGTGMLAGTTGVSPSAGYASFSGLYITAPGTYTLTAKLSGFGGLSLSVTSAQITVKLPPSTVYIDAAWTGPSYSPGTAVTWTDGSTHYIGYDAFSSIQSAVNAVAPDGTVDVASGAYSGLISVSGVVNIVRAGESATTIMGSGSGDGIDVTGPGASLTASGLAIEDFSVGLLVENDGYAAVTGTAFEDNATNDYMAQTGGSGTANDTFFDDPDGADVYIAPGAGTVAIGTTAPNAFAAGGTYIADQSSEFINASNNTFGGVNPATATTGQIDAIESGITDATDSSTRRPGRDCARSGFHHAVG